MRKNIKKRPHMTFELRKFLEQYWNKNIDGLNHKSISQVAKVLDIPTLRFETNLSEDVQRLCVVCIFLKKQVSILQVFSRTSATRRLRKRYAQRTTNENHKYIFEALRTVS